MSNPYHNLKQIEDSNDLVFYKNDSIVFGKVLCTHCGSDSELLHVELSALKVIGNYKKIESYETTLCKPCYRRLPEREDNNE
jgi:hypothetical protein